MERLSWDDGVLASGWLCRDSKSTRDGAMRRPQSLMRGDEMACASAQMTVPEHLPANRHLARPGKVLSWTVDAHDAYEDSAQCSNDERNNLQRISLVYFKEYYQLLEQIHFV